MNLGDSPAERVNSCFAVIEGFVEPGPAHLGEEGIGSNLNVDISVNVGNNSSCAFPTRLPYWIVENHQSTVRDGVVSHLNINCLGVTVRG